MMQTKYKVTTSHANWPAGTGTFELTVHSEPIPADQRWGKVALKSYVAGGPFGCSRDYYVATEKEAIANLLGEHATTLVSVRKVRG